VNKMKQQQLEARLNELKAEFESGKRELVELEAKQTSIEQTLERLSCAIHEIEEMLKK
jgi:DNA repair exonuclease SbcCD ATPase subunit